MKNQEYYLRDNTRFCALVEAPDEITAYKEFVAQVEADIETNPFEYFRRPIDERHPILLKHKDDPNGLDYERYYTWSDYETLDKEEIKNKKQFYVDKRNNDDTDYYLLDDDLSPHL